MVVLELQVYIIALCWHFFLFSNGKVVQVNLRVHFFFQTVRIVQPAYAHFD